MHAKRASRAGNRKAQAEGIFPNYGLAKIRANREEKEREKREGKKVMPVRYLPLD
jgi:hypothetical protein